MSTTVQFIGHASFEINTGSKTILIDPFITGNPQTEISLDSLQPDVIIISHGHADHVGDVIELAQKSGALVIANFEIAEWLGGQGVENVHPLHIGGGHNFDFGRVQLTIAHHGSALPDGSYGGNPAGILLTLDDATIYHAADTGLFYDMKLIGEAGIDLAILPIGDNFTMGPADSLRAIKLIEPKQVIPCHYNTWEIIEQDPKAWAESVKAQTSAEPIVLSPGESCTL